MSLREVYRLTVIQAVTEDFLTPTRAAQRLQLSTRQVHRLVQRYRDAGVSGLTSRKHGQPSNHQLRPGLEQRAAALIREHYPDFGPPLAAEKLAVGFSAALGMSISLGRGASAVTGRLLV